MGACVALLAIGLAVSADFGVSWDEPGDSAYGADALSSYGDRPPDWQAYDKRKFYGPAHFMLQAFVVDLLEETEAGWPAARIRHSLNLLAFLVAVLSFHSLVRGRVSRPAALVATFLFLAQPLYIGHAFINGKDTPFMAAFLLALALGFGASKAFSRLGKGTPVLPRDPDVRLGEVIRSDWRDGSWFLKWFTFLALAAAGVLALGVVLPDGLMSGVLGRAVDEVVTRAYEGRSVPWLSELFYRVAEDASFTPAEVYVERAKNLVSLLLGAFSLLLLLLSAVAATRLFRRALAVFTAGGNHVPVLAWRKSRFLVLLLLAGVAMGLASSVRVIGPLAALLVAVIFFFEHRSRTVLAPLGIYLVVGLATMLALWPFLWEAPSARYLQALSFMASHPWRGYVLYAGDVIKGRLLPWYFLPHLMGLQFTEPAILLFVGGCVALASALLRGRGSIGNVLVLGTWSLLPILPLIGRERWLYDNFRQFLFVTPVIFVVAAEAIEAIFDYFRGSGPRLVLAAIALLPGLAAVYRLHPYPYIHYNAFVGGVQGAFRRYELDYWATAYREATERLNEVLPYGTRVAYWGTTAGADDVARPDLVIRSFATDDDLTAMDPEAVVLLTRANVDETIMTRMPGLPLVTIEGATLVVVKSDRPDVMDRVLALVGASSAQSRLRE